ncbi:bacteriocin ABC transporter [Spiroplasma sp. TIUS-1]|uniref:ATP-binding cassette domain-containing protein n=1 Tax=Spiroplasma sp. TIUS-1 TaxID=216963 RepID=UPI001397741A|nr:ATP-binding cassette domain-containing protein [Spiroplasma sp. TIUS-1]QHX35976.1 bacteriocin ABC transporter [Spiroplasma sp. TIUS-1]
MKYSFINQNGTEDCAHAVITMVVNTLHNKNYLLDEIKLNNKLPVSTLSFLDIENTLFKYNISFETYSSTFKELVEFNPSEPVVLNVMTKEGDNHFIVVYKFSKSKCLVGDPNSKELTWESNSLIEEKYLGFFGICKKDSNIEINNSDLTKWMLYLKKHWKMCLIIFFASIIVNLLVLISSVFTKIYLENATNIQWSFLTIFFLMFGIIYSLNIFGNFVINKMIRKITAIMCRDMFVDFKKSLLSLDVETFSSITKDEWIKKISDISEVANRLLFITMDLPIRLIMMIVALAIFNGFSNIFLVIIFLESFAYIFISTVSSKMIKKMNLKIEKQQIEFSYHFRDMLDGFEQVKTKYLTNYISNKIDGNFSRLEKTNFQLYIANEKLGIFYSLINKIFYIFTFFIGAIFIDKEKISAFDLLFLTSISSYIFVFINLITNQISNYSKFKIATKNLDFIFDYRELNVKPEADTIKNIKIENLSKYIGSNELFSDLNFEFKCNTFISGKSGSGKTSLLKVIAGVFKNYSGKILLNGINLRDLSDNYFKDIKYLSQYDYLFHGTVWENIQQFRNKIDLELFDKLGLSKILNDHNISLNKEVIDNGSNFSKGQRQIINFISLFFTDCELYILDEPLSNVDKKTAKYLIKNLMRFKKDRMFIMCDHDESYKEYFEEVISIEK